MPRRIFKYDKDLGRVVEATSDAQRAACEEISASLPKPPAPWDSTTKAHKNSIAQWPIHSEQMAVNPEEVGEAKKILARHGVKTDYDKLGRPILRDPAHRKAHAKVFGFYDRNAGYGDPMPANYVESSHSREAMERQRNEMREDIRTEIRRLEHELGLPHLPFATVVGNT